MNKTIKSLKRAVKVAKEAAAKPIPIANRYQVAGRRVRCSHCDGELFEETAFEWMVGRTALVCVNCGHLEVFAREVDE